MSFERSLELFTAALKNEWTMFEVADAINTKFGHGELNGKAMAERMRRRIGQHMMDRGHWQDVLHEAELINRCNAKPIDQGNVEALCDMDPLSMPGPVALWGMARLIDMACDRWEQRRNKELP